MLIKKPKKLKDDGQALFEFIVFLPFLIYLFTLMVTISNSINASINQQKATRGYFYYLMKGNSMAPTRSDLRDYRTRGITGLVGITAIGWREKSEGDESVAPCFKFSTLFSPSSESGIDENETCDTPSGGKVSQFVRVYTLYGVCGATYSALDGASGSHYIQNVPSVPSFNSQSCTLR
jgi:hypothetical protein